MNIESLRTFIKVAELKSFKTVADRMNLTQPAVAKRIHALEDELRQKLFVRNGNKMFLTPTAKNILAYAQRIVELHHEMCAQVFKEDEWRGIIRIGAVDTILVSWLSEFLSQHRQKFPKAEIEITSAPTVNLLEALYANEIDIAFLLGPSYDRPLIETSLGQMEVGFFRGKDFSIDNEIAGEPINELSKSKLKIITFPRGSKPHQNLEFNLKNLSLRKSPRILNCVSVATMYNMAERGLGVATLPLPFANETDLVRVNLGFDLEPLNFSASFVPGNANEIIKSTCLLAEKVSKAFNSQK